MNVETGYRSTIGGIHREDETDAQRVAAVPTTKEAELGNPDAMSILSRMHRHGFGVKKDERTAEHYAEMERNAEPFELPDEDDTNPWAGSAVKV